MPLQKGLTPIIGHKKRMYIQQPFPDSKMTSLRTSCDPRWLCSKLGSPLPSPTPGSGEGEGRGTIWGAVIGGNAPIRSPNDFFVTFVISANERNQARNQVGC